MHPPPPKHPHTASVQEEEEPSTMQTEAPTFIRSGEDAYPSYPGKEAEAPKESLQLALNPFGRAQCQHLGLAERHLQGVLQEPPGSAEVLRTRSISSLRVIRMIGNGPAELGTEPSVFMLEPPALGTADQKQQPPQAASTRHHYDSG